MFWLVSHQPWFAGCGCGSSRKIAASSSLLRHPLLLIIFRQQVQLPSSNIMGMPQMYAAMRGEPLTSGPVAPGGSRNGRRSRSKPKGMWPLIFRRRPRMSCWNLFKWTERRGGVLQQSKTHGFVWIHQATISAMTAHHQSGLWQAH